MRGFRILEVAEHTFVPLASGILAEWGADVIKIEHVQRGDATRNLGSSAGLEVGAGGVHVLMEHANRGKRSLGLDLSTPQGRAILYRLAEDSDVFLTNKLPAVEKRLKLTVEDIRAHNPSIVYARGTGYGPSGPDADHGGYDMLGFWARAGIAAAAKRPETGYLPPLPVPAFGDSTGAMFIAGGIATALLHRERTGEALVVDVSLLATGMWAMGAAIGISQRTGSAFVPTADKSSVPRNPLVASYRTADDHWITFCMLQGFHYWPEVCLALEHPDWIEDRRFDSAERLADNYEAASELIAGVMAGKTSAEWNQRFRSLKGQWSPAQDSLTIADDPMVAANGYLMDTHTADGVRFALVTSPVQFDGHPAPPLRAPRFNEHAADILSDILGLNEAEIADLKAERVIA